MLMLKVAISLCLCFLLNIGAVPIITPRVQSDDSVRPIEEIFQELDGYHQNDTVGSETSQSRDGVVRPIEEIFGELDYQNDSATVNLQIAEFLRIKREITRPVRSTDETSFERDGHDTIKSLIFSTGSYLSNNIKENLSPASEQIQMFQEDDKIRPIEEIFQELDMVNQNETDVEPGSGVYHIIDLHAENTRTIKPIEDLFEKLDNYHNHTTFDDSDEQLDWQTKFHEVENINIKLNAENEITIKPIEEIFEELDTYHNETIEEPSPDVNSKNVYTKESRTIKPIEDLFEELDNYQNDTNYEPSFIENDKNDTDITVNEIDALQTNESSVKNINPLLRNSFRPGMVVNSYVVDITPNVAAGTFSGRLIAQVSINDLTTIEEPIMFQVGDDLSIASVVFSIGGGTTYREAEFFVDEGILEIMSEVASLYTYIIEYEGRINQNGNGLYMGLYDSK